MDGICVCLGAERYLQLDTDFCLLVLPAATYVKEHSTVSHDHGKIKVQELSVASRR
jgi:hypothetical protein